MTFSCLLPKDLIQKSYSLILLIVFFSCLSRPAQACLEIPVTPPDMNVETCNSFPQLNPFADYTILRLLDYSTYGANTDEYCACALNLPFQFGVVDSAAIVYSGTNTPVEGWDFSMDADTGFGPSGTAWQGFSSAVSELIPSGIEVDVVFIIAAFCEEVPSRGAAACCDDFALSIQDWFENGGGLFATDGANPDGSPSGEHTYIDAGGNVNLVNPSCFDGVINGDEEGNFLFFGDPANCGGSQCPPCETQFLELMDPCSCESTYVAGLGFQDTLRILTVPGSTVALDVNNGGFNDQNGMPFALGATFEDGGASDNDGLVNGEIVVPFYRDENEVADIVVDGVTFVSPAPCPLLTDCDICDVQGGSVGGSAEVCFQTGISEINFFEIGQTGPNLMWMILIGNDIISISDSAFGLDYECCGPGVLDVAVISYEDGLTGLSSGASLDDLDGCFAVSSGAPAFIELVEGGFINQTIDPIEFCVDDGISDVLTNAEVTLGGQEGQQLVWYISEGGVVTDVASDVSQFDFEGLDPGICLLQHAAYTNNSNGVFVGQDVNNIAGCVSVSNSVEITKIACNVACDVEGGTLSGGPYEFCVGDNNPDFIMTDDLTLSGAVGPNMAWVITDDQLTILGLPNSPEEVDFEGAGGGTCLIWHLSFEDDLTGAEIGMNAANLGGCFSLSNSIAVIRNEVDGGTLVGGPYEFCIGDGIPDFIMEDDLTLTGNVGMNSAWVITDADLDILALPDSPEEVDFDGSGVGTCLIWHISFEGNLVGDIVGLNAANLQGCFSLSNSIEVIRELCDNCMVDGGTLAGGPYEFCVGDGNPDFIMTDDLTLTGNVGPNSAWVITDDQLTILGLPNSPEEVDFEGAGGGTCLIWHLSFEDDLTGAEIGMNAANLGGCFSLSNSIPVVRNEVNGGTLTGGPYEFCVGDGNPDFIMTDDLTLSGNIGANSAWVITDDQLTILGLPNSPEEVDFEGAGAGICLIWNLSFEGNIMGAEVGLSAADLQGCFSLSNPIQVTRIPIEECCQAEQSCSAPDIASLNNSNNAEADINAAGLTIGSAVLSLQRAVTGTASFDENEINASQTDGDIAIRLGASLAFGAANSLTATYSLSTEVCDFNIQIWDVDQTDEIILQGFNNGVAISYTTILGSCLSQSGNVFTPNGAVCEVQVSGNPNHSFNAAFDSCIDAFEITIYDKGGGIGGSYSLVIGEGCTEDVLPEGGTLSGGPYEFCAGDGEADFIMSDDLTLTGAAGANSAWVITDEDLNIVGLPQAPEDVNFDGAGFGICLIWHLSFEDGLIGAEIGANAANLQGCYDLSNSIAVVRTFCCPEGACSTPDVASLNGSANGESDFNNANLTVGNSIISLTRALTGSANFDENEINASQTNGDVALRLGVANAVGAANSLIATYDLDSPVCNQMITLWDIDETDELVITGSLAGVNAAYTTVLGSCIMQSGNVFRPDGPPCEKQAVLRIRHTVEITFSTCIDQFVIQNYDQGGDDGGSYSLVIREGCEEILEPDGGVLTGGPYEFCVGDGNPDFIMTDDLTLSGDIGTNSAWVITDEDLNILGLPNSPEEVDFEGAGSGTCLIWNVSFEGELIGAEVGANAADLIGCYDLSNSIAVVRNEVDGGVLAGGPYEFCVGDGNPDFIMTDDLTLSDPVGANSAWVITDEDLNILGLPNSPEEVDFEGAGAGTCLIWHLSFEDGIMGAEVGANAADLIGCYDLSNSIAVVRNEVSGGVATGGPYQFCVGDGEPDFIMSDDLTLEGAIGNTVWVVTDELLNIVRISPIPENIDFDGDAPGNCLLWAFSFEGNGSGLVVGENVADIQGCFALSNSISITKEICVDPCEENLLIEGSIDPNLYEASSTITSTGSVDQGMVEFSAGECINLNAGFEVDLGNVFHAFIEGCTDE